MAIDIGLNQLFTPIWQVINIDGTPLSGGGVFFFDAEDHDLAKNVYTDATGTTAWPNPITLNAQGIASIDTATYGIYGSGLYYIEVRETTDRTRALIFSQNNYRAPQLPLTPPEPPYFSDIDISNFILNAQFSLHGRDYDNAGVSVPDLIMDLAAGGWVFVKNDESSNDSVTFQPFVYGQTDVPAQPMVYFQYQCNSISATESLKYLGYRINNYGLSSVNNNQNFGLTPGSGVSTLNGQTVTIQFNGISSSNSSITFSVYQYFGANGSAPVLTPINTFDLINQWSSTIDGFPEYIQFAMPSIAGKTIDPNGGDYLELRFNLPLNSSSSIGIANISLQNLSLLVGFQPPPINQLMADIAAYESTAITTSSQMYKDGCYLEKVMMGSTQKILKPCAGLIATWPTNTPPDDALICNGTPIYSNQYYNLANLDLAQYWGAGPDGFTSSVSTATVTAICFTVGAVTAGNAGTTPFTFTQTVPGNISTAAEATILCTDASTLTPGMYIELNSPNIDFYPWFSLNNTTPDPGEFLSVLSGKEGVKIIYTGSETDEEIADLLAFQIKVAQSRLPDFRGLFPRMANFGASAVFPFLSKLTLSASVDLSGTTLSIIGLDKNGEIQSETLSGPNNNTVESTLVYSAITSVTPNIGNSNGIEMGNSDDPNGICLSQGYTGGIPFVLNGIWARDIDWATRGPLYFGGEVEDSAGSFQLDQNLSHVHSTGITFEGSGSAGFLTNQGAGLSIVTGASGGNQSNPKNVYINFIIYF